MARNSNAGMGILGWLTILFIALKLCDVIDWSWWWVLSPVWGGVLFTLSLIVALVAAKSWSRR